MGADDGVLIDDDGLEGSDSLGVAKALAAAVKELNPDIILCGSRAVDYDQGQRGAMVAELLALPHLALAVSLQSDGTKVTMERPIEGKCSGSGASGLVTWVAPMQQEPALRVPAA
jgi:electron transfer flavoprotein beta subunit